MTEIFEKTSMMKKIRGTYPELCRNFAAYLPIEVRAHQHTFHWRIFSQAQAVSKIEYNYDQQDDLAPC